MERQKIPAALGDLNCFSRAHATSKRPELDWFRKYCVAVVKFAESFALDDVMVEQSAGSYNTRSEKLPVQDCDIYGVICTATECYCYSVT
jgi:hypothetical protein